MDESFFDPVHGAEDLGFAVVGVGRIGREGESFRGGFQSFFESAEGAENHADVAHEAAVGAFLLDFSLHKLKIIVGCCVPVLNASAMAVMVEEDGRVDNLPSAALDRFGCRFADAPFVEDLGRIAEDF